MAKLEKNEETLGGYLHRSRVQAGLSQWEVAKKMGYTSAQFISNIERGVCSPPLKSIRKLIDIYKIDPNEIFSILLAEQERLIEKSVFGKTPRRKRTA